MKKSIRDTVVKAAIMALLYMVALAILAVEIFIIISGLVLLIIEFSTGNPRLSPIIITLTIMGSAMILATSILRLKGQFSHSGGAKFMVWIKTELVKPSYIQFIWLGLILIAIGRMITFALDDLSPNILGSITFADLRSVLPFWPCIGLSAAFAFLYYAAGRTSTDFNVRRFAPESSGLDDDEFGYKLHAIKSYKTLIEIKKPIIVATIDGGVGSGKSSYLKMMMTSSAPVSNLYTYISLTETNEEKSFSKLFAQRWSDTLRERYPSLIQSARRSVFYEIARESSGSTVIKLINLMLMIEAFPLRQMSRILSSEPSKSIDGDITPSLFGFVPKFQEDAWVIVIDEIERAKFDELYRAIETIERFRMEAEFGLPIKLVFILCIDRIRLRERVKSANDTDIAALISSFLERELRTVDIQLSPPPVSPRDKNQFIVDLLKSKIIEYFRINLSNLDDVDSDDDKLMPYYPIELIDMRDVKQRGILDNRHGYDWMFGLLTEQTPRMIKRIITQTNYMLAALLSSEGQRTADQIRFSDLVVINLLRSVHPIGYQFLVDVHPKVFVNFHRHHMGEIPPSILVRGLKKPDANMSDFEFLFRTTMKLADDYPSDEIFAIEQIINKLIYPIASYATQRLNKDAEMRFEYEEKPNYDGTIAQPENLWDVLTLAETEADYNPDFTKVRSYEVAANNGYIHDDIRGKPDETVWFAKGLRRYYPGDYLASRTIVNELLRLLLHSQIPMTLAYSGQDTILDEAASLFGFHFANFLNRDETTDADVDWGYKTFKQFLIVDTINLETKLRFISLMFVFAQTGRGGNPFHFDRARKKIENRYEDQVKKLIDSFMVKALDRYGAAAARSIYDNEEHFFYAMYQTWNGNLNDHSISRIRDVATYGLEKHPEAILAHWQYRVQDAESGVNTELYLSDKALAKITDSVKLPSEIHEKISVLRSRHKSRNEHILPPGNDEMSQTMYQKLRRLGYITD